MASPRPTHEQQALALAGQSSMLRARDAAEAGIPTAVLTRLVRAGRLQRVGRGLYALPYAEMDAQRSLAEVALSAPRGVICLLSALRAHEIGTQAPFQVWLALPQGVHPPRQVAPSLRVLRMSGAAMSEGIETREIDGVAVPIFNATKTVADCFKFRNKVGLDVALEALREGWRQRKLRMDELWHYAEVDRVSRVMRPYIEALTA
jgi:predicted transcriptional regulator of viral defense system